MISTQESTALVLSLLPEDEALHVLLSVNGGNRRWCAMPEEEVINRDIRVWDSRAGGGCGHAGQIFPLRHPGLRLRGDRGKLAHRLRDRADV